MSDATVVLHEIDPSLPAEAERPVLSAPADSPELPAWFREQKSSAWKQFETLPMPTRKDQPWRFSNVTLLDLSAFNHARPLSDNDRARILDLSRGLDQVAGRLIFGNDHLLRRDVLSEELQRRGVIFQPLERAIHEHAELFRKH